MKENGELSSENIKLNASNKDLQQENKLLDQRKIEIIKSIDDLNHSFEIMQEQSDENASRIYEAALMTAQAKFAESAERERLQYLQTIDEYKQEVQQIMEDSAKSVAEKQNSLTKLIAEKMSEIKELDKTFESLKATVDAAADAAKRAVEMATQVDFYKIQISQSDKEEIRLLREITPQLRDQEPLCKVIWKVYYEKPTTDLIGRVIGQGVHIGIYKITDQTTGRCYVGQAVNIADRWKQHIKRGLGAETATRNKLYPAMMSIGVENFTFEIVEECDRDKLDEREDFWQDYFHAKDFGYSIK